MKELYLRLKPEVGPYVWKLVFILLSGAVLSGIKASLPSLLELTMAQWTPTATLEQIAFYPALIFAAYLFMSVIRYFHTFWAKYIGDLIAVKIRKELMDKYLLLGGDKLLSKDEQGSGGLISKMINDVILIQNRFFMLTNLIKEPLMILFLIGYLMYVDWKLTIFVFAAAPVIALILKSLSRSLRKYSHQNQEVMEDLTKTLKESIDGSRVVQSFNLEDEMRNRFNKQSDSYLFSRKKIISREVLAGPLSEVVYNFATSALLIYVGLKVTNGALTKENFIGFTFALGLIADSIRKTQEAVISVQHLKVAFQRLDQILDLDKNIYVSPNPKAFPADWKEIEFKDVEFSFDDAEELTLNKINLRVKRGEVIALVGSSGGGKSTLVNLLERFFDPTAGAILIDGIDIKDFDLKELRHNIGLVNQDVFLFSDSIERNIHLGDAKKDIALIESSAQSANAHDFIMKSEAGYKTEVGDRGSRLSGGEKQRLSIARAMFKNAPILILDEATSALDSESEKEVQSGLERLMDNKTAFVIAHRLSTITSADRIVVLKKGQIVELGTHKELIEKQGEYYRLHEIQTSV